MNNQKYPFKIGQKVELLGTGSAVGGGGEWVDKARKGDIVTITGIATYGGNATVNDPRYYGIDFNVRGKDLEAVEKPTNDKFKPGDIVNIIDLGKHYPNSRPVFEQFGFKNTTDNDARSKCISENDRYWTVVKTGEYKCRNFIMIESEGIELLITEDGLEFTDIKSHQEWLLDEAINRYPIGTRFRVVHKPDIIIEVTSHERDEDTFIENGGLYVNLIGRVVNEENDTDDANGGAVYFKGKWAEIVEIEVVESEIDKLLKVAKEKYPRGTNIIPFNLCYLMNNAKGYSTIDGAFYISDYDSKEAIWVRTGIWNSVVYADGEWCEKIPNTKYPIHDSKLEAGKWYTCESWSEDSCAQFLNLDNDDFNFSIGFIRGEKYDNDWWSNEIWYKEVPKPTIKPEPVVEIKPVLENEKDSEWIYKGDVSLLEPYSINERSKKGELCVVNDVDNNDNFRIGDIVELNEEGSIAPYIIVKRTGKQEVAGMGDLSKLPTKTVRIPEILYGQTTQRFPTNSPSKHNDIQIPNEPVEIFIKKKK